MTLSKSFENYQQQLIHLQAQHPQLYDLLKGYVPEMQLIGLIPKVLALVKVEDGERALP